MLIFLSLPDYITILKIYVEKIKHETEKQSFSFLIPLKTAQHYY